MDALNRRREEDMRRLQNLACRYGQKVQILENAGQAVKVRLWIPTARDNRYPSVVQGKNDIEIVFPRKYPFDEPIAQVLTPVWNPNIFPTGKICLGVRWIATEGLDLLVERIMRLIAFDPRIINTSSPANEEACKWYKNMLCFHKALFPTIDVESLREKPGTPCIVWKPSPPAFNWKALS